MSNKTIITRDNLINIILDKCKDDYISTNDLLDVIDKSVDEHGAVSKKKLIKSIRNYHTKAVIKDVYNILEESLFECLLDVDRKNDVSIKLFEGITLDGTFVPEKIKKNNLTGKTSLITSRIKPKFNITRYYAEKLNK